MSHHEQDRPATQKLKADLLQLRDEIQLKVHLGGMEARERWEALKPRFAQVEQDVTEGLVAIEADLLDAAQQLRDELGALWRDKDA